jgi:hypothetical protein
MKKTTAPKPIPLPDAIKLQVLTERLQLIIEALGIDVTGKSLKDLTQEAVSRAKVAKTISEQMASCQAYIDAASDSIGYGKPEDLKRALLQLEKAQKNLIIGLAAIQADAKRQETKV